LDKIDDEDGLRPPEVTVDPEESPDTLKDIEQDEVRSNTGSGLSEILSIRKQVPDVTSLVKPQVNPEDGHKDVVDGEWSWMSVRATPNAVNRVLDKGNTGGIIEVDDYAEEEREERENLVGLEILVVNLTVLAEWVCKGHYEMAVERSLLRLVKSRILETVS